VTSARTHASPLDNAVWHALTGPLSRFARAAAPGAGHASSPPRALRFDPEVSVFAAVDRLDESGWTALAELVGPGGMCAVFRDAVPPAPAGWQEHYRGPCFQMVADHLPPRPEIDVVRLGAEDAPDMLELTSLTEPGPFLARTHELGRYIGVRREGRLVAMAGERFSVPGLTEVSAVCTHPSVRGEGLGGALTLEVAYGIRERGDEAFLHLLQSNETALRLYERLGFRKRRDTEVVVVQWHDDGLPWDAPRPPGEAGLAAALPDPKTRR